MSDNAVAKAKKPNIFVRAGKGISRFFREYKSEVKKIVWPDFRTVVKNTVVVLVMCVVIGIGIWLTDFICSQVLDFVKNTLLA